MATLDDPEERSVERRTQTICLMILTALAVGVGLSLLRQVLVPFVLALFFSMIVTPAMDFLQQRWKLPRGLAIGSTLLLGLGIVVLFGSLVSTALGEIASKKDTYVAQVEGLVEMLTPLEEGGDPNSEGTAEGVPVPTLHDGEPNGADDSEGSFDLLGFLGIDLDQLEAQVLVPMRENASAMIGGAISWTIDAGLTLMSRGFLVTIFIMFLIIGHRPPSPEDRETFAGEIRTKVMEYIRVKVLVSAITGFLVYAILKVIGVDLALVFGVMAFLLNFIPNIGSAIAVLLPLPVVLLAGDLSITSKVLALALPAGVQFFAGNVLEPKWMGRSLDLNPIVILLALIFWGVLWGPVGMLLSVPITSVCKMLLERLPYTQPVARLLSDSR